MQDRRKARKEESRTGELQDRWVAGQVGCSNGWMQDRTDTVMEVKRKKECIREM